MKAKSPILSFLKEKQKTDLFLELLVSTADGYVLALLVFKISLVLTVE